MNKRNAVFAVLTAVLVAGIMAFIVSEACLAQTRRYLNPNRMFVTDRQDVMIDQEMGYVRIANAVSHWHEAGSGISYTIYTDHLGARVNGPYSKTGERVGIMTIGGSFSEGHGMENHETFTEVLGRRFGVPVANFAIGSYGGVSSLMSLKRHAGIEPRIIIYGMIDDHLSRNVIPCARSFLPECIKVPYVDFDGGGTPFLRPIDSPLDPGEFELEEQFNITIKQPSISNRIAFGLMIIKNGLLEDVRHAEYEGVYERKISAFRLVIGEMKKAADLMGARLVVLYIPKLRKPELVNAGGELLDGIPEGVVFVDAAGPIRDACEKDPSLTLCLSDSDSHPNAEAHRILADILAEAIVRHDLLMPGGEQLAKR